MLYVRDVGILLATQLLACNSVIYSTHKFCIKSHFMHSKSLIIFAQEWRGIQRWMDAGYEGLLGILPFIGESDVFQSITQIILNSWFMFERKCNKLYAID